LEKLLAEESEDYIFEEDVLVPLLFLRICTTFLGTAIVLGSAGHTWMT
jgi:hypothetical protein